MATIKFDAWDRQNNILLTGDSVILQCKDCSLNAIFEDLQHRFIFLRYSGLPDKNGQEIREGHLINSPDGMIRVVVYKLGAFLAVIPGEPEGLFLTTFHDRCTLMAGDNLYLHHLAA